MALLFQATDYTPPSSPTHPPSPSKFSDSMTTPRLTRTPTPPTKPVSVSPAKPPSDPQSNITKALRTLHRTTSAFALRPQASAASLRGPGSLSPGPRETSGRWPFSRATTATSVVTSAGSEVGGHFERVLVEGAEGEGVGERVVDGRRRGEARERVLRMRGWLVEPEGNAKGDLNGDAKSGERERVRVRVDSGTYEGVESSASTDHDLPDTPGFSATTPPPTPPTPTATETQTHKHDRDVHLPPLHEDTLFLSLHGPYTHAHARTHTPRPCTYCNTPGAAWTLHGCGHGVHARCVGQLGGRHSREKKDGGCVRCEGLGRWVGRWGVEGVRARVERLERLEG